MLCTSETPSRVEFREVSTLDERRCLRGLRGQVGRHVSSESCERCGADVTNDETHYLCALCWPLAADAPALAAVVEAARGLVRRRRGPGMLPCVTISGESWAALQAALAALPARGPNGTIRAVALELEIEGSHDEIKATLDAAIDALHGGQ